MKRKASQAQKQSITDQMQSVGTETSEPQSAKMSARQDQNRSTSDTLNLRNTSARTTRTLATGRLGPPAAVSTSAPAPRTTSRTDKGKAPSKRSTAVKAGRTSGQRRPQVSTHGRSSKQETDKEQLVRKVEERKRNRWLSQTAVAVAKTGVPEPDESLEHTAQLQQRLNEATSELFHVPMRFRRSWSRGVQDALVWTSPAAEPQEEGTTPASTQEISPIDASEQSKDSTSEPRTLPRSRRGTKLSSRANQMPSARPPPPPPPTATQRSTASTTRLIPADAVDAAHRHALLNGTADVTVPTVPVATSSFRPRTVRERDPRAFKYLPTDWTRVILAAGQPAPRGEPVANLLAQFD